MVIFGLLVILFLSGALGWILNLVGGQFLLLAALIAFLVVFPKCLGRVLTGGSVLGGGYRRGGGARGLFEVLAWLVQTAWALAGALIGRVLAPLGSGSVRLSHHSAQVFTDRVNRRLRQDSGSPSGFWPSDGPARGFFF